MKFELQNVTKQFGDAIAVDDVDLSIAEDDFFVLLGPSGSGKSTLLRLIAGLEDLTAGAIYADGRRIDDLEPSERDIAVVFQSYALYPHLSVRRNIAFPLVMGKIRAWHHIPLIGRWGRRRLFQNEAVNATVNSVAASMGLEALLERYPRTLSGGQRQRVALGRAIVRQPSAFLMDEPLSNLDAQLRTQMRSELVDLQRRLHTTCIYVTHDQTEALTMGTKIAVVNQGKVQQCGSPLEVFERPANTFVASFIGSPPMNLLPAEVRDGALFVHGVSMGSLAECGVGRRPAESNVVFGCRPEAVTLNENCAAGELIGVIRSIEDLGHEVLIAVDLSTQSGMVRPVDSSLFVRSSPAGRHRWTPGTKVGVSVSPSDVSVFSADTGERL